MYLWDGSTTAFINSTLFEGNIGADGILQQGAAVTVVNSTISASFENAIVRMSDVTLINSTIAGGCDDSGGGVVISLGHNIESPGNTCGFDQETDQVNVGAENLKLGPLADNGGPTMTHALGAESVAIDRIPEAGCVDANGAPLTTDQRGVARPQGDACDVGAFELEP